MSSCRSGATWGYQGDGREGAGERYGTQSMSSVSGIQRTRAACGDDEHCRNPVGVFCRREAATSRSLVAAQEKEAWATAKENEASERLQAARVQEEELRAELYKAASAQEAARTEVEQATRVPISARDVCTGCTKQRIDHDVWHHHQVVSNLG